MTKRTKKETKPTATNLKNMLFETLLAIKDDTIDPKRANAIAAQSREICRVAKLQLDVAKLSGKVSKAQAKQIALN